MELIQQIENLLFIAGKPMTYQKLADLISGPGVAEIKKYADELAKLYKSQNSGLRVIIYNDKVQMVTRPEAGELVERYIKEEYTSELSKPSVETLTIIAYRGPITKLELERIRGINCSLILRNLLLRGLIEEKRDSNKRISFYTVSLQFLKHLGVSKITELPDYERLRKNENIDKFLAGEA